MGRHIPSRDIISSTFLSVSIFITWIIAMVAIISSLCGIWPKKRSKSCRDDDKKSLETTVQTTKISSSSPSQPQSTTNHGDENSTTADGSDHGGDNDELTSKPLPPPPLAAKLEFGESNVLVKKKFRKQTSNIVDKSSTLQNYISKGSTRRKLSTSMSMKLPSKFKEKAHDFKDKAQDKAHDLGHHKKKDHESLWQKRIILGEKCKLPNQNNPDDEVINNSNDNNEESSSNTTADVGDTKVMFNKKMTQRLSSRVYSRSVSCIDRGTRESHQEDDEKRSVEKGKGKGKFNFYSEDDS